MSSRFAKYLKGILDHKESLPDDRDRPFTSTVLSLPLSATVDSPLQRIRDQEVTSSCVGQAVSVGVRLGFIRMGINCPELSPRWVYRGARNIDGTQDDVGTYLRSGVKCAQKLGIAREVDFAFDSDAINDPLTLGGAHGAFDRRGPRAYYRILTGPDGVRRALADGYPVVGGVRVSDGEDFMAWTGSRPIPAQTTNIVGGHALVIVGYNEDGTFSFRNSWSEDWGIPPFDGQGKLLDPAEWPRGGYGWASEAFIAQFTDLWALDLEAA